MAGIDLKVAADIVILSPVTDYIITGFFLEITAYSGITQDCSVSIGKNATAYDNLWLDQIAVGLNGVGAIYDFPAFGKMVEILSAEVVKMKINTGAVGTTLTARAHMIAYEKP